MAILNSSLFRHGVEWNSKLKEKWKIWSSTFLISTCTCSWKHPLGWISNSCFVTSFPLCLYVKGILKKRYIIISDYFEDVKIVVEKIYWDRYSMDYLYQDAHACTVVWMDCAFFYHFKHVPFVIGNVLLQWNSLMIYTGSIFCLRYDNVCSILRGWHHKLSFRLKCLFANFYPYSLKKIG